MRTLMFCSLKYVRFKENLRNFLNFEATKMWCISKWCRISPQTNWYLLLSSPFFIWPFAAPDSINLSPKLWKYIEFQVEGTFKYCILCSESIWSLASEYWHYSYREVDWNMSLKIVLIIWSEGTAESMSGRAAAPASLNQFRAQRDQKKTFWGVLMLFW